MTPYRAQTQGWTWIESRKRVNLSSFDLTQINYISPFFSLNLLLLHDFQEIVSIDKSLNGKVLETFTDWNSQSQITGNDQCIQRISVTLMLTKQFTLTVIE